VKPKVMGLVLALAATCTVVVVAVKLGRSTSPTTPPASERPAAVTDQTRPVVYPFRAFNFVRGQWTAYLLLSPGPEGIPGALPAPCMRMGDPAKLTLLSDVPFVVTGGDLGTPGTHMLVLVRDGEVVQFDGLMLSRQPLEFGIQRLGFGYLAAQTPQSVFEIVNGFEPVAASTVDLPPFELLGEQPPYVILVGESDEETGLYYFGARCYDPRRARWAGSFRVPVPRSPGGLPGGPLERLPPQFRIPRRRVKSGARRTDSVQPSRSKPRV
jgi:hypothetical protein